jgi:peptidoglycan LD-endopeptidase LytH
MKQPRFPRQLPVAVIVISFLAGVTVDSLLRTYGPPKPATGEEVRGEAAEPGARGVSRAPESIAAEAHADRSPKGSLSTGTAGTISHVPLRVPIDGVNVESMKGGFDEQRPGHEHEAVDILAPRNTPVHAVENGTIAKLFYSKGGGGNTVYEFDPTGEYAYYYAHLERYADGLRDGQVIKQGDVIGYVGTSGNAPPNTPHLHFAVFELNGDRQWWKGKAVDPYPFFK